MWAVTLILPNFSMSLPVDYLVRMLFKMIIIMLLLVMYLWVYTFACPYLYKNLKRNLDTYFFFIPILSSFSPHPSTPFPNHYTPLFHFKTSAGDWTQNHKYARQMFVYWTMYPKLNSRTKKWHWILLSNN